MNSYTQEELMKHAATASVRASVEQIMLTIDAERLARRKERETVKRKELSAALKMYRAAQSAE